MLRNQPRREAVKKRATKKEKQHAKSLGAQSHAASGAANRPGDYSTSTFLFDSKTTSGGSIRITSSEVARACTDARQSGKKPALVIELGATLQTVPKVWVAVPLEVFKDLLCSQS